MVYSRRKKTKLTQPPLDQPNDQLDAPRMGNPKVIPSPTLSIDTSIKELTQLNLESKTCYPSTKWKPSSHYGFANCTVKYPISHYMSLHYLSPSYKTFGN